MSVLVVGLSHKSASLPVLERAAVSGDTLSKLIRDVSQAPNVGGTFVVSTCNRVEVYAGSTSSTAACRPSVTRWPATPPSCQRADLDLYALRGPGRPAPARRGLRAQSTVVGESRSSPGPAGLVRGPQHGTLGLGELGTLAPDRPAGARRDPDRPGANLVSIGIAVAHGLTTA
jgi:glutamyl-tRNA reductase